MTAFYRAGVSFPPEARVWWLTFSIAFGSMIAHIMSDSACIVMIPLGARACRAVGRSPVLGLMVAYASTAISWTPEDDAAADRLFDTTAQGEASQHSGPTGEAPSSFTLSTVEKRAMRLSGAMLALYINAMHHFV
ncbi:AbgT family transporter [Streptomyces sp. NEAU-YJ-81]|uniref:AbgT family transporter n=1 Tax=Streptomyces sp. NEAU-YJ-81 TaxID=2820288 RepID=UPI001ABD4647|nr:AbgT family transporter [Streptomyces sp. NEAU-YJ-81]MBO3680278.1 AbgT family transporter [Streptomyces sp. NEAU-YJ-81]